eukprot:9474093-Pyramimonas_sp.AAC.1
MQAGQPHVRPHPSAHVLRSAKTMAPPSWTPRFNTYTHENTYQMHAPRMFGTLLCARLAYV